MVELVSTNHRESRASLIDARLYIVLPPKGKPNFKRFRPVWKVSVCLLQRTSALMPYLRYLSSLSMLRLLRSIRTDEYEHVSGLLNTFPIWTSPNFFLPLRRYSLSTSVSHSSLEFMSASPENFGADSLESTVIFCRSI